MRTICLGDAEDGGSVDVAIAKLLVTRTFPVTEVICEIEEVRGRVGSSDLTTILLPVRGLIPLLVGVLLWVDDPVLAESGALPVREATLLCIDVMVEAEVVRDRDGPAS